MKIKITERQIGLLSESMSVGPDGELNFSSDEMDNIIGKKVGDVFGSIPGINIIGNKLIAYYKFFQNNGGSFDAFYNAQSYLEDEGYVSGSMMMGYPIPFMMKGKTGVNDSGSTIIITKFGEERPLSITKFDRLSGKNWDDMDGVILPDPKNSNFRDNNVYVIFFNFPE